MSKHFTEVDLALARGVRLEDILAMHGIALKRQGSELVGPCPVCGGHDRFAVNIRKAVFNCRGCGARGGAIDLEMHVSGSPFIEAVPALAARSVERPARPQPAPAPRAYDDNKLECADRIWRETVELPPQPIEYFASRGIDISSVPDHGGIRFHPQCRWERGTTPCVVARFTTVTDNRPQGVWRRPLSGEKPRTLGPQAGCVIRLWDDAEVTTGLVLGEGVETVFAAATGRTHGNALLQPAWAAGCAGNMASFPVLPGIEHLTLLVDHDENGAGERAAEECARRWIQAGREIELLIPNEIGADFNDLIKKAA